MCCVYALGETTRLAIKNLPSEIAPWGLECISPRCLIASCLEAGSVWAIDPVSLNATRLAHSPDDGSASRGISIDYANRMAYVLHGNCIRRLPLHSSLF